MGLSRRLVDPALRRLPGTPLGPTRLRTQWAGLRLRDRAGSGRRAGPVRSPRRRRQGVVVGHSWGAYLALLTALAHPETTAALVYISGNGTPERWREQGHAIANARTAARLTRDQLQRLTDLEERARSWDEEVEFRRLKWMTDFVEHSPPPGELEEMATTPLSINFSVNRALSRAELYPSDELLDLCDRCEVPTLLIHGSHDPRPDVGAAELADHLPNPDFVRVDGAGHLPWVEQPDATMHLIKDFIASTR